MEFSVNMAYTVAAGKFSSNREQMLSPRQDIDMLLNGDYQNSFNAQDYFSDTTSIHVFDVISGIGSIMTNLTDEESSKVIKVSQACPSLTRSALTNYRLIVLTKDDCTIDYDFRVV